MSHLVHGLTIIILYVQFLELFQEIVSPLSKIFGGIGFFVAFILAITSSDYAIQKLGFQHWKSIHRFGMYYLWFIFFVSYLRIAISSPGYGFVVLFLIFCLGLRLIYRRKLQKVF